MTNTCWDWYSEWQVHTKCQERLSKSSPNQASVMWISKQTEWTQSRRSEDDSRGERQKLLWYKNPSGEMTALKILSMRQMAVKYFGRWLKNKCVCVCLSVSPCTCARAFLMAFMLHALPPTCTIWKPVAWQEHHWLFWVVSSWNTFDPGLKS